MPGERRSGMFWIGVLLALFSAAGPGVACTVVYPGVSVGPNFRVNVADRGRPVQGLEVGLFTGRGARIRSVTNKDGIALFRDVPEGSYNVGADHDAGIPDGVSIRVRRSEPSEAVVPLRWPSSTPILASSLKGSLYLPDWISGQPQPSLSLELLEAVSGRKLKSGTTDEKGSFDFAGFGRGLYFLRLNASAFTPGGLIAVEIEPGVTMARLDLSLGWNSCGLHYIDHSKCPPTNLHLDRLEGRVVDATESAIQNAEILVLSVDGKLAQQTRSDSAGRFAPLRPEDGTYQLMVRAEGFGTLRGTLAFDSNGASLPLEFQLGVAGLCGRTKTK
jgi:hypothetical protein